MGLIELLGGPETSDVSILRLRDSITVSVLQLCSPSQYLYVRGNVENTFLVFQEQNCHSFSSPATNGQMKKEKPSTNRASLPSLDVGKQALNMIQS